MATYTKFGTTHRNEISDVMDKLHELHREVIRLTQSAPVRSPERESLMDAAIDINSATKHLYNAKWED